MKVVVKSDGKVVREKELENKLHFEVQLKTRMNVVESKKTYSRHRQKDLQRKTKEEW